MKLAVMQPYFFPYLGYWQLINAVDKFVIYDNVNYIKGGWINRNNILINNKSNYISIPLEKASQNKLISDTSIESSPVWKDKMLTKIDNTYRQSPYFLDIFPLLEKIILYKSDNLVDYLVNQLIEISNYLGIKTEFIVSSQKYNNADLKGQNRILDICTEEKANTYINLAGGKKLYNHQDFNRKNINLRFLEMTALDYQQGADVFIPALSIVDVLMGVKQNDVHHYLNSFTITK